MTQFDFINSIAKRDKLRAKFFRSQTLTINECYLALDYIALLEAKRDELSLAVEGSCSLLRFYEDLLNNQEKRLETLRNERDEILSRVRGDCEHCVYMNAEVSFFGICRRDNTDMEDNWPFLPIIRQKCTNWQLRGSQERSDDGVGSGLNG